MFCKLYYIKIHNIIKLSFLISEQLIAELILPKKNTSSEQF